MFKTEAIILYAQKIRDHQTRIILFTRDYGRISCWDQSIKHHYSSGDILSVSLERKNGMNHIKSIEVRHGISFEAWKYKKIYAFLQVLHLLYRLLPESLVFGKIYDEYKELLSATALGIPKKYHYILFKLRILKHLGYIGEAGFRTPLLAYVYKNITCTPISSLMEAKDIGKENIESIETLILQSLYLIEQK